MRTMWKGVSDNPVSYGTSPTRGTWPKLLILAFALLIFWRGCASIQLSRVSFQRYSRTGDLDEWCPLPDVKVPEGDGLESSDHFNAPEVLQKQLERLSAAVKVPTESFDDNGDVDADPRWETFDDFHDVLEALFPLVHSRFKRRKVNRYGLIYTLDGANALLKPLLLTAHQDVVPAGPASSWSYPPFAAHYDGSFLWGRGSTDCKNVLIGILSALEDLLAQSFVPHRTLVLAFGFDEETGGERGAKALRKVLQDQWGSDSFLFVLDEGGMGVQSLGDVLYALPGVAEKGYHDVHLTLDVSGGHSSRPPSHTGIGIAAAMIVALEKVSYVPRLTQTNPFRRVLECKVKYSPDNVQPWLEDALQSGEEEEIARRLAEETEDDRWLMQTSQAIDIISGGIKVNALPEKVEVTVNHRIAPHESITFVNHHMEKVLTPLAKTYGIEITQADGIDASNETTTSARETGSLTFSYPQSLVVAPISPTTNAVWDLFSGTLRHVFQTTESGKGRTVVPVGDIMTGNTDTQRYWNLTRNIYRYSPAREGTRLNAHAVDERIEMTAHVEGMRVYYDLIRNFDMWDGE